MAMIDRNFDFATNGTVSAAALHNLIDSATIYQFLITGQQPITSVGTNYKLLIADGTNANAAPNAVTVYDLFEDALTAGTYSNANISEALTYGTATGNRTVSTSATITTGTITTGVIPTLTSSTATFGTTTSTAATITSGTITNLNSTTGTIATLNSTTGTIATLNSTTGTIATLNSTTGTIGSLSATTSTFLGAITGSTNEINIGSGQIHKAANGNVTIGGDAGDTLRYLDVQNTNSSANAGAIVRLITRNVTNSQNIAADIVKYKNGGFTISNGETDAAAFTSFNVGTAERLRIASAGQIGIDGENYGTSGQVLTSGGAAAAPSWQAVSAITSGTAVSATSGTAIDFIGIPSGVKKITIIFNAVSLNGAENYLVQIGSTTFSTSGYVSTSNETNQASSTAGVQSTSGFSLKAGAAGEFNSGIMTIVNVSSNTWVNSHAGKKSTTNAYFGGGNASISGTLDRVRITNGGSNTFDAGIVNIMYES